MDSCIQLKKENNEYNCSCLTIDFKNRLKYLNYIKKKYDIYDKLLHTLYISNRNQLRSYMKHYHNFNIDDLD